jgi:hypothetical protein
VEGQQATAATAATLVTAPLLLLPQSLEVLLAVSLVSQSLLYSCFSCSVGINEGNEIFKLRQSTILKWLRPVQRNPAP